MMSLKGGLLDLFISFSFYIINKISFNHIKFETYVNIYILLVVELDAITILNKIIC
jgi:hypothetical protein